VYNLDNIIGQTEVINSLENAFLNKRVGHAYLFSGQKGIGKTTLSKAFASLLLCNNPKGTKHCGSCKPCLLLKNNSNPDFSIIEKDGLSIKIEQIRAMQEDIMIKPFYSERKVYILKEADTMTTGAQNCILKTLEEPPGFAVLVLTTHNIYNLQETVRSRLLRYSLKKNSNQVILEFLNERYKDSKSNEFIAAYSDGIIGTALRLSDSSEFESLREKTIKHANEIYDKDLYDIFGLYKFFEENKEDTETILNIMELFYRDLLIYKKTGNTNMLINYDKKVMIVKSAKRYTVQKLVNDLEAIASTKDNIRKNANFQLSIEVMLMKLREGKN